MKYQIQAINFEASETLLSITTEKLGKLERFYDHIDKCHVMLKKENDERQQGCIVEVRLSVPGYDVFAAENAESFEQAVIAVISDLTKQLKKFKSKIRESRTGQRSNTTRQI